MKSEVHHHGVPVQEHARVLAENIVLKDELASTEQQLLERFADKKLGEDHTKQLLPPELIEQAKLLKERGTREQMALAEIALKNHSKADEIIQSLKQDPLAESHRLLTHEGDNWFRAGDFDKAVGPFEQALSLEPNNVASRNNVMLAHCQARLGDFTAHCRRAIEVGEGTLQLLSKDSTGWASTQNNLGNAWQYLPTGNRDQNLKNAIACYEAALKVDEKNKFPVRWAMVQNNLGNAWRVLPTGNHSQNLEKAIAYYNGALTVYSRETEPAEWARTQNNLALALANLPTGDIEQNLKYLPPIGKVAYAALECR